jgi:hypothetical protein
MPSAPPPADLARIKRYDVQASRKWAAQRRRALRKENSPFRGLRLHTATPLPLLTLKAPATACNHACGGPRTCREQGWGSEPGGCPGTRYVQNRHLIPGVMTGTNADFERKGGDGGGVGTAARFSPAHWPTR